VCVSWTNAARDVVQGETNRVLKATSGTEFIASKLRAQLYRACHLAAITMRGEKKVEKDGCQ
jgi:hypothetical protein